MFVSWFVGGKERSSYSEGREFLVRVALFIFACRFVGGNEVIYLE